MKPRPERLVRSTAPLTRLAARAPPCAMCNAMMQYVAPRHSVPSFAAAGRRPPTSELVGHFGAAGARGSSDVRAPDDEPSHSQAHAFAYRPVARAAVGNVPQRRRDAARLYIYDSRSQRPVIRVSQPVSSRFERASVQVGSRAGAGAVSGLARDSTRERDAGVTGHARSRARSRTAVTGVTRCHRGDANPTHRHRRRTTAVPGGCCVVDTT